MSIKITAKIVTQLIFLGVCLAIIFLLHHVEKTFTIHYQTEAKVNQ